MAMIDADRRAPHRRGMGGQAIERTMKKAASSRNAVASASKASDV
ncbi:hypothetical protein [Paraburkholderia bryophila]|jgi:hypothetical protein|nr:hypothetical protein [Paraburkholderia bryophila]